MSWRLYHPAVCVQILASLRVITGEDGTDIGETKRRQLRENSRFFREGLEVRVNSSGNTITMT